MPQELRTFGGLDLRDADGVRVEPMLAHSKGMALLAYLAAEGREAAVSRGELAALLWPDREEKRAQNALRITLTRIRQDAGPALVQGKRESHLRLDPERVAVDLWAFDDARKSDAPGRALKLYDGHFLHGFRVDDASPFERWADGVRERCCDQAYEAALAAGESARDSHDFEAATAAFGRALELRPLRERGAVGLVRTLAERGRTAEALTKFEAFEQRRREELELEPSDEFRSLMAEVRAGELEPSAETATDDRGPVADDEVAAQTPRRAGAAPAKDSDPGPAAASTPTTGRGSRRRRIVLAAAVILLVAAVAVVWQLTGSEHGATAASVDRTVAVLPFESMGEDSGGLAAGLHTDLLTRLSHVSELDVISGTSVNRFRNAGLALPAIADSLGAQWVVEGSVEQFGNEMEVNVQLIDPSTDTHSWAETYRRGLTADNLFDIQSEISGRVAGVVATRVAAEQEERLRRRPTGSLEAYRLYVRGRGLLEQRSPPEMERSLDYFDRALAVDSGYALAWAGKADALSILARYPAFGADTLLPRARDAADRALRLDPDLAEAHAARARLDMYRWEGPEALRGFERAVALRPSYAAGHAWRAKLLLSLGKPEEALRSAERAVELDPLSMENLGTLVYAHIANDDPERALAVGRRATELNGSSEGPSGYERIALSHLPGVEDLRSATHAAGLDAGRAVILAARLVEAGDSTPARDYLDRTDEAKFSFLVAFMRAALGEPDRALAVLRRHYPREQYPWDLQYAVYLRYFWPDELGVVRELPGYADLISEMNRTWGLNPDGSLPGG